MLSVADKSLLIMKDYFDSCEITDSAVLRRLHPGRLIKQFIKVSQLHLIISLKLIRLFTIENVVVCNVSIRSLFVFSVVS